MPRAGASGPASWPAEARPRPTGLTPLPAATRGWAALPVDDPRRLTAATVALPPLVETATPVFPEAGRPEAAPEPACVRCVAVTALPELTPPAGFPAPVPWATSTGNELVASPPTNSPLGEDAARTIRPLPPESPTLGNELAPTREAAAGAPKPPSAEAMPGLPPDEGRAEPDWPSVSLWATSPVRDAFGEGSPPSAPPWAMVGANEASPAGASMPPNASSEFCRATAP
jgi:hypothetical protein